jgi:hypothetical protein
MQAVLRGNHKDFRHTALSRVSRASKNVLDVNNIRTLRRRLAIRSEALVLDCRQTAASNVLRIEYHACIPLAWVSCKSVVTRLYAQFKSHECRCRCNSVLNRFYRELYMFWVENVCIPPNHYRLDRIYTTLSFNSCTRATKSTFSPESGSPRLLSTFFSSSTVKDSGSKGRM